MKIFACDHCRNLVFFENTHCEKCGHKLGFTTGDLELHALEPAGGEKFVLKTDPKKVYRYCFNHSYGVCNWLVEEESAEAFCRACRHNRTIPDLSITGHTLRWAKVEQAKHRLIYQLLRLKLPLSAKNDDGATLVFDFIADTGQKKEVMTGHDNGLITLNMTEADDVEREMARRQMHEAYRTLLGHFRHEIGHYYWDRLVDNTYNLGAFRGLFGDDRKDYQQALDEHYRNGAPANWPEEFISAYATMHPWEDWAETWAHYLHIMDTLETCWSMGLSVQPGHHVLLQQFTTRVDLDPYTIPNFYTVFEWWLPVAMSLNSINRSMGQPDLYPFVIPPKVSDKLAYMHTIIHRTG